MGDKKERWPPPPASPIIEHDFGGLVLAAAVFLAGTGCCCIFWLDPVLGHSRAIKFSLSGSGAKCNVSVARALPLRAEAVRRVTTRFDKLVRNPLAAVLLASARL